MLEQNSQWNSPKPIYKKWWFWLILFFVFTYGIGPALKVFQAESPTSSNNINKADDITNNSPSNELRESPKEVSESPKEKITFANIGDKITTEYFEITLNKAYIDTKIETGNMFADKKEEEGIKYLILDITFKNIDTESRLFLSGSVFINYNGNVYQYDKAETILEKGWGTLFDQINPLILQSTKLVYKIPSEIAGQVFWEPARNVNRKAFFCGRI